MSGLIARVGYETAPGAFGKTREVYHAVLSGGPARVLRIGYVTRRRGEALCGAASLADCPPGLFAPQVSCPACLAIAAREGVTVADANSAGQAAAGAAGGVA